MKLPPGAIATSPIAGLLVDEHGNDLRVQIDAARPFSPMPGLRPLLQPGSSARSIVPPLGANLSRPRTGWPGRLTLFEALKMVASSEFARAAMNDIKGQIQGMAYEAVPVKGQKGSPAVEKALERVRNWMRQPDPMRPLSMRTMLSSWLEEILVTDALSLVPRWNMGGEFIGMQQLNGETIQPWVDAMGVSPIPGTFQNGERMYAYVQWAHGRPETGWDIDTGQYPSPAVLNPVTGAEESSSPLWYKVRHPRTDSPYGRSEAEMLLITLNLAVRQQLHDLGYYTERTLPEGIYTVDGWSGEKIAEFQKGFDERMLERSDGLAGALILLPKGAYVATKTRQWDYEFFEAQMRLVAWVYQVSPASIAKQSGLGGSQSDTIEGSVAQSGTRPKAAFLEEIITGVIQGPMGYPFLEFRFAIDEAEEPEHLARRQDLQLSGGHKTLNEIRRENGDEAYGPQFDRPFVKTGATVHFLDDIAAGLVDTEPVSAATPTQGRDLDTTDQDDGDPFEAKEAEKIAALAAWQHAAIDRQRLGKRHKEWGHAAIPELVRLAVQRRLEAADSPERIRAAFLPWLKKKAPTARPAPRQSRAAACGRP